MVHSKLVHDWLVLVPGVGKAGSSGDVGAELPGFTQAHVEQGFDRIVPRPPFFTYAPKIRVLRRKKEVAGAGASSASAGGAGAHEEETFFGDV